jgi:putative flippase GtrA
MRNGATSTHISACFEFDQVRGNSMLINNVRRPLKYVVAGGLGFAVDATTLVMLTSVFKWQPISARLLSFMVAVTATWWINRRYAFSDRRAATRRTSSDEYLRYLTTQSFGAGISLLIFVALLWRWPVLQSMLIVPLAIGSICALCFNFYIMDRFVFPRHSAIS